jgi:hypothetical protein
VDQPTKLSWSGLDRKTAKMTHKTQFESAYSHLTAALPILDELGLLLAAADVSTALSRMERSDRASRFDLAALADLDRPNAV